MVRQSPRKARQSVASYAEQSESEETVPQAKKTAGKIKAAVKKLFPGSKKSEAKVEAGAAAAKKRDRSSVKREEEEESACESHGEEDEDKPAAKKRKTKKTEKMGLPAQLAARTAIATLRRPMYIGAHVSAAGGVDMAVGNALQIGANAFALFLKSQRKWSSPPLDPAARDAFKAKSAEHGYLPGRHVLPHGSYLVNLASPDPEMAAKAYDGFLDDLKRCEELGIKLYNFHPGNTNGAPRPEALARIAAALNKSHKATKTVVTVLENMAGTGNTVGSSWEDLRDIIALVEDKERVGVCIDTCHTFAAGYDLRSAEAFAKTMGEFDEVVGLKYLKALHLNDSKAPLASNRDVHANIGTGFLGLRAFHNVVNYAGFEGLPMVLETPIDRKGADGKSVEDRQVWADEIKLLEGLVGADADGDEFREKEAELARQGAAERAKFQDQADRKAAKGSKGKGAAKAANNGIEAFLDKNKKKPKAK